MAFLGLAPICFIWPCSPFSHKDISSARNLFRGVNSLSVPDGALPASTTGDDDDDDDDSHHVVRRNGQVTPGAPDKRNSVGSSVGSLDPEAPANYNYGRRRSRAVLYQLSGHYGQATDKKAHKKMHNKIPANVSWTTFAYVLLQIVFAFFIYVQYVLHITLKSN